MDIVTLASFGSIFEKVFIKDDRWKLYLTGLGNTLAMSLLAIVIGVVIGLFIAIVKNINKNTGKLYILDKICDLYVTIIRGIPMMLQLYIMYFVVLAFDVPIIVAAIAFGVNSGAYVAEIFRAGLTSVDKGQMEASRSLGMSYAAAMTKIVVPQAMRNAIPPLGNEFIALIKETAIVGAIGIVDLTKASNNITAVTYEMFMPLMISAVFYLIIVLSLTQLMKYVERRLSKSERK